MPAMIIQNINIACTCTSKWRHFVENKQLINSDIKTFKECPLLEEAGQGKPRWSSQVPVLSPKAQTSVVTNLYYCFFSLYQEY